MAQRKSVLLVSTLLLGALLRAPFLVSPHREGDERDALALVAQMSQGEYSLRHATEINRKLRRAAYVDAPLYHHPPLYAALGWISKNVVGDLYVVTYLASLAVIALTFLVGCQLRDPLTGF